MKIIIFMVAVFVGSQVVTAQPAINRGPATAPSTDREKTLTLIWDEQVRQSNTSDKAPHTTAVGAMAVRWGGVDNPSLGGWRTVEFVVDPHVPIPKNPDVRFVELRTMTQARIRFFWNRQCRYYVLRFTDEGKLYDIVNCGGESGWLQTSSDK